MQTYKLLAELLDYPNQALVRELDNAVTEHGTALVWLAEIDRDNVFSTADRQAIAGFIDALVAQDATEREAAYVATFDMVPEHSLHLTHHLFGDDKNRGPALIDLSEYYKSFGFTHEETEIPDFLPLMLEFVSQLDAAGAKVFLADVAKIFTVLAQNLEKAGSPYAPLIRILENHGTLTRLAA